MSARYFCIDCWQTVSGVEQPRPPAALETVPAPAAAPAQAEAAPGEEILPAPPPVARRSAPPVGLHWIEDPNRAYPSVVRAAPAPARPAAATAPAPVNAVAALAPVNAVAAPAAGMRRKWETLVETLLGEDEAGEAAETPPRGPVFCSCGAPLGTAALLDGKPALLGFAGGDGAGKTLLLAAMLHQLELAEPPADLPRIALQGLGDSDEFFRGLRRDLFRHGRKPPSIADKSFGWRLKLARSGADRRPQPLRGGVSQLVGVRGGDGEQPARHDELLGQLLFLIDGAALAADLQLETGDAWLAAASPGDLGAGDLRRFSALCARLGPRARDVSLAIVVTKADLLAGSADWAELGPGGAWAGAERQEKIAGLLQETWRGSIWEEARDLFRRAGLFACSSLGFRPTEAELDPEGNLNRRPQPHRVLEPLHFLLEDVLPRRRA